VWRFSKVEALLDWGSSLVEERDRDNGSGGFGV